MIYHSLLFILFWILTSFVSISLALLMPARELLEWGRQHSWTPGSEDLVIQWIIVCSVVLAAFASRFLVKFFLKSKQMPAKFMVLIALIVLTYATYWAVLEAGVYARTGTIIFQSERFTLGPFPTKEDMSRLRDEGYTAIISLLHPALLPVEPGLIQKERAMAQKTRIQFINIPMLAWVSDNQKSLAKIRQIVRSKIGRYYIHCYLGQDRINVVKRILQQEGEKVLSNGIQSPRSLDNIESFERGKILRLGEGVYLIPYPTDEEFFGYVLSGKVKAVVSLMNPELEDDKKRIEQEKKITAEYKMPFYVMAVKNPSNKIELQKIVSNVQILPHPLVIHHFNSDSAEAKAFAKTYTEILKKSPHSRNNLMIKATK